MCKSVHAAIQQVVFGIAQGECQAKERTHGLTRGRLVQSLEMVSKRPKGKNY